MNGEFSNPWDMKIPDKNNPDEFYTVLAFLNFWQLQPQEKQRQIMMTDRALYLDAFARWRKKYPECVKWSDEINDRMAVSLATEPLLPPCIMGFIFAVYQEIEEMVGH